MTLARAGPLAPRLLLSSTHGASPPHRSPRVRRPRPRDGHVRRQRGRVRQHVARQRSGHERGRRERGRHRCGHGNPAGRERRDERHRIGLAPLCPRPVDRVHGARRVRDQPGVRRGWQRLWALRLRVDRRGGAGVRARRVDRVRRTRRLREQPGVHGRRHRVRRVRVRRRCERARVRARAIDRLRRPRRVHVVPGLLERRKRVRPLRLPGRGRGRRERRVDSRAAAGSRAVVRRHLRHRDGPDARGVSAPLARQVGKRQHRDDLRRATRPTAPTPPGTDFPSTPKCSTATTPASAWEAARSPSPALPIWIGRRATSRS